MARETLAEEESVISYKSSTDIQVAGMLIYYILSGGHHPFGDISFKCESNIYYGKYSLDHVQDVVAKDLIECMINKEPKDRPKVEECLNHPFFWTSEAKTEYLRKIGNRNEVANYRKAEQELIDSLEKCAVDGSFKQWKNKFPQELVRKLDGKKLCPENTLGLLRFIRNLLEHYGKEAAQIDKKVTFDDEPLCAEVTERDEPVSRLSTPAGHGGSQGAMLDTECGVRFFGLEDYLHLSLDLVHRGSVSQCLDSYLK
ncbi:serine/threonine-protein kinase ppk4-like, partial [Pundamilia nyererei]|uniref:Serine/threonine-protein kinase ppk4-like n=1 Tax=Pundamilia nyererei TaxID=303518 RepID=A0A9Y3SAX8_9CICH